ncbi:Uncharacterized protein Y057_12176 [Fusarium fujikuroi]|nr:Uncharacterized protein Y057_12176 [Fusarium fujikuroi]
MRKESHYCGCETRRQLSFAATDSVSPNRQARGVRICGSHWPELELPGRVLLAVLRLGIVRNCAKVRSTERQGYDERIQEWLSDEGLDLQGRLLARLAPLHSLTTQHQAITNLLRQKL